MKMSSSAAARNAEPILEVLRIHLTSPGLTLEVASGTGQHSAIFSRALPQVRWQASDRESEHLASIEAWRADSGAANFLPPVLLDVCEATWPIEEADAIFCANMIHISPWASCAGLLEGTGRILKQGAPLILYGPYRQDGIQTAPSNEAFDASLRARDPEWGLRDLELVQQLAAEQGLRCDAIVRMPANNLCVVFRRD